MRLRPLLLTLTVLAVFPSTAAAAVPGDTLLASGLPGLGAPDPADFAFNVSGQGTIDHDPAQSDMTAGGNRVVFTSLADGLVSTPEERRYENVFVKDRATGALIPVAPGANGSSRFPSISDDGLKVVFETTATNLVPNDTTPDADVVMRNLATGTYKLLSSPGDDGCGKACALPQLSGNGLYVAFATRAPLLPLLDTNTRRDVYRVQTVTGATELVDRATGAGGPIASSEARGPSISYDGNRVAFDTEATGLGAGTTDTNGQTDVYLRDLTGATTILISGKDATSSAGDRGATEGHLSGNGQVVSFTSQSTNLVGAADTSTDYDIYARTIGSNAAGTSTQLVSRTTGAAGAKANDRSYFDHISDTGTVVTFISEGTNLGGGFRETYVRSLAVNTTTRLGAGPSARVLALNGDGTQRLVYGGQFTPQLEPGLSVINVGATTRQFISRPSDGTPLVPRLEGVQYASAAHALSATGRYVVFVSASPALPGARSGPDGPFGLGEHIEQAYRRDQQTGTVDLISRDPATGMGVSGDVDGAVISGDGTTVAFTTDAALDPADTNTDVDVYVRDVAGGTTTLASRADGPGGSVSTGARAPDISGDGSRVAFAAKLGGSVDTHIYIRDLQASTTTLVDRADGAAGAVSGTAFSRSQRSLSISQDGMRVAFVSDAKNLGDGDTDSLFDVHVRDLAAGTTTLVSRQAGANGVKASSSSRDTTISGDGRRVAFASYDAGLDPSAGIVPPTINPVYVRDLVATTTTLVSRGAGAGPATSGGSPALSADGAVVAYATTASELNAVAVRRTATGEQSLVTVTDRSDPSETSVSSGTLEPSLTGDGGCVSFTGYGTGLVTGVSPDYRQLFTRVLSGDCGTTPAPPPVPGSPLPTPPVATPSTPLKPPVSVPVRPRISSVRLTRSKFRVSPRARTKARKVKKAGTKLSYRLNVPATVTVVVQRRTSGRKVGRSCRKATKKLRKRKRCTRYLTKGRVLRKLQKAGTTKVTFSGRFGRRGLPSGRYRFSLVATARGLRSPTVTKSFRIIR